MGDRVQSKKEIEWNKQTSPVRNKTTNGQNSTFVSQRKPKKGHTVHSGLGDEKNEITSSPPKKKGKWKKRATDNKVKSQAILINTNLIKVTHIS